MFRTTILSIVFSLALGQNAAWLCKALCAPAAVVTNHCGDHPQTSQQSQQLSRGHDCNANAPAGTAYVKEDGQRTTPAPRLESMRRAAFDWFVSPTRAEFRDSRSIALLEKQPLDTALRI